MKRICIRAIGLLMALAIGPQPAIAELLFFDNFEYLVNRDATPSGSNAFISQGGWSYSKADNLTGRGDGRIYTTNSIPGYSGPMPGQNSTRVMKIEAQNRSGGTDIYLAYGGNESPPNTIPANVWFQWWMYINHHPQSGETSGLERRHKWIYPCDGDYPCNLNNLKWLMSLSADPVNTICRDGCYPFPHPQSNAISRQGEAFIAIRDQNGPDYSPARPDNHWKLGPNMQSAENAHIVPNQWQLIRVNLDTSVANRGKFQVWIMPMGGEWRKVSEWIAGVTPNFTWTHAAGGHRVFRMPTTIGWSDTSLGGAYYYIDDFAMANSEDSLPVYGNQSGLPRPPSDIRVE